MTLDYIITVDYREHGPITRLECRSEKERGWRRTAHDWLVGESSDDIVYIYFRPFSISGPFAEAKVQVLFTRGRRQSACLFPLHQPPWSWPTTRLYRSRLLPMGSNICSLSDVNETGPVPAVKRRLLFLQGLCLKWASTVRTERQDRASNEPRNQTTL